MDRKISSAKTRWPLWLGVSFVAVFAALGVWSFRESGKVVNVRLDRLDIDTVTKGPFRKYINLSGTIAPATSLLLDCRVPGNVEQLYVHNGDEVAVGDTLVRLSNAELELSVLQRESQLLEQLNTQRQTVLLLNQDALRREEQLAEVEFRLALGRPQLVRATSLYAEGLLADDELEPVAAEVAYQRRRLELLRRANAADSLRRYQQLQQLVLSEQRLLSNLGAVRQILDRLYVLAPVSGTLVDVEIRVGQRLSEGDRIGELYQLGAPKVEVQVDEFYLGDLTLGQEGVVLLRGDSVRVFVERIDPAVEGGQFRVRLSTDGRSPALRNVVLGQSVRARLLFGAPTQAVQLSAGDFYNSTGGRWVYVLEGEDRALRRSIQLGRRTPLSHEVLTGLAPDDRVITSSYEGFAAYPSLVLSP